MISLITVIDFYNLNDLHGKFDDAEGQAGVDELSTYLRESRDGDDHSVFLSSGDMWQGSAESNATSGMIITDWMSELDFAAMTLGNHEFDWGSEAIYQNAAIAEFPILAINIFESKTNTRPEYAKPSTTVECGDITVGIIGAIGDCYSSIAPDKVTDVYFKVGYDLTALVMAESERLRTEDGADIVVYILHDGYGRSSSSTEYISSNAISSYYDVRLSDGYIDLVFEGHSHQSYVQYDANGVYHLQGGGDNRGISHVELGVNSVTGTVGVRSAEHVPVSRYSAFDDDPTVDELLQKYDHLISGTQEILGTLTRYMSSDQITDLVAKLYYEIGVEEWGDKYDIVLGGGYLSTRSPYDLERGDVTYADLWAILPFDNVITLCSVKGSDLLNKFINTSNSNYHIFPTKGDVGTIDRNKTYYIIVDSYTAQYAPNKLTVIADLGEGLYARDLLAEYIRAGKLK
jgi:2',3'-cyclic-nucleotide 2'-phosphodiesterase/3'-nucleotidase